MILSREVKRCDDWHTNNPKPENLSKGINCLLIPVYELCNGARTASCLLCAAPWRSVFIIRGRTASFQASNEYRTYTFWSSSDDDENDDNVTRLVVGVGWQF